MSKIIDISQKVCPEMAVYPGDPRYQTRTVCGFKLGDMCEVSELTMGSHCGTHIDAPLHMIPDGKGIDTMPLDCFYGPCRVLTIGASVVSEKMLADMGIQPGERILLRTDPTGKYARSGRFNPAVLSMRAAQYLAQQKVLLVGIDSPTVENMELCDGEVHRELLHAGVVILEGVDLREATEERYFLSALPLRLSRENGAPCRAVLLKED